MEYTEIREKVIQYSLQLQKAGLIRGTSGNISLRSKDGKVIAITPTGIPYDLLTPDDIPLVDDAGIVVDGRKKPSSELPMHLEILRFRKDLASVIHTHSLFCTVFAVMNRDLPAVTIPQILCGISSVKVVPFEFPGTQKLGQAILSVLGERGRAALLQNHGVVAAAPSLEYAYTIAEYLEEAAQVAYYAYAAGALNPIAQEAVDKMTEFVASGKNL